MAEWLQWVVALGGLAGLGGFLKVFFERKNNANAHSIALLDQYQEDRAADRALNEKLHTKVDQVLKLYHDEHEYSTVLLAWGLAGAPPPPPQRQQRVTITATTE